VATASPKSGTLSVKCACGAYLEIDPRFAGQTIQCPDCQKPLAIPTIEKKQTSGLALASLIVGLVGILTLFGPLAAILLGLLGLRSIARQSDRLAGKNIAVAGIVVGVAGLALSVGAYLFADRLGLDGLLREIAWRGKLDYTLSTTTKSFSFKRPSPQWGVFLGEAESPANELILIQPREDAFVAIFDYEPRDTDSWYDDKAICDALAGSGLVTLLNRRKVHPLPTFTVLSENKRPYEEESMRKRDLVVEVTLAGQEWSFLVQAVSRNRDGKKVMLVGATHKRRFARMEAQFAEIFKSGELTLSQP
jgi:hypothetical protein